jgi:transcriptional regulator with XRE-family HTH domain
MKKATNIDKEIGEQIRINRVLQNRSRKWLGDKIGISYHQVQNYELGRHRISASCLLAVSQFLKTPISQFFPKK